MKRAIAFEREAKKKTLEVFDERKKRKRERERETLSGSEKWCFEHRAFSRFTRLLIFIVDIIIAQSPLSLLSLSLSRARARSRDEKKIP